MCVWCLKVQVVDFDLKERKRGEEGASKGRLAATVKEGERDTHDNLRIESRVGDTLLQIRCRQRCVELSDNEVGGEKQEARMTCCGS